MFDNVNKPKHYNSHPSGIECIQITEHHNFNIGNAIKYLWRTDHKNGLEDLKKAAWYINREIQRLEGSLVKDRFDRPKPIKLDRSPFSPAGNPTPGKLQNDETFVSQEQ